MTTSFKEYSEVVAVETENSLSEFHASEEKRLSPMELYLLRMGTDQSRKQVLYIADQIAKLVGAEDSFHCDWSKMRRDHLMLIKTSFEKKGLAPSTINLYLSVMRGIAEEAWNLGLLDDHEYAIIKAVHPARGYRDAPGRALTSEETKQLFTICDEKESIRGVRDAAILALGIGCGLRRAEIVSLKLADINETDKTFTVIGKGNKERRLYCSEIAWERLSAWLEIRGKEGCKEVFCRLVHGTVKTKEKAGYIDVQHPITRNNVYMILREFKKQIPEGKHFSPHDLRRTFATRLFQNGADIYTVKKAMGHAAISTTERYDKRGDEEVKRVSRLVKI